MKYRVWVLRHDGRWMTVLNNEGTDIFKFSGERTEKQVLKVAISYLRNYYVGDVLDHRVEPL